MNFDGFLPHEITRFSSLVEQDDPTNLPLGVGAVVRNTKFHLTGARTRDGIQSKYGFVLPGAAPVTGLASLKVGGNPDTYVPMAFDITGSLYIESPVGSGNLKQVQSTLLTPPQNASMQVASAYKRGYLAFTDLKNSLGAPAVYDIASGKLDPLSMKLVGQPWSANTQVQVGECMCPTAVGGNGHLYRCTTAGITGAVEPAWNLGTGSVTNDGTAVWTETTPVMSSTGVGNICAGLRYMVVLFLNRNGYISGMSDASVVSFNVPLNGSQLRVTPIPTGPSNTVARILAFTPAGQLNQIAGNGISNAGPYFWIPPAGFAQNGFNLSAIAAGVTVADIVNGVTENSTLINDNVTTDATFNFDDNYLKSTLLEVSPYFRKIQVPNASDIYYSSNLRRMFYKVDALPSGWYVSLQDDPESVYGDTGILQVAENNGENAICIRDFGAVTYAFKERSGHVVAPNVTDPTEWEASIQWEGSGPCGVRAIDVATGFLCYVHRSGIWIFKAGEPVRISKEIPLTWSKINWQYQQTIWVKIDEDTQEIHIGVPYGQSTVPNIEIVINYEESPDFSAPIHFSPYIGKEIATGACYKYSINDIAANLAIRAERPLVNPPVAMQAAAAQSQLLYASSNPDGSVSASIPLVFNDNGVGIDWVYETVSPNDMPNGGNLLRPNNLGGVQANVDGAGLVYCEVLALRAKDPKDGGIVPPPGKPQANAGAVIPLKKPIIPGIPYSSGARGQNERFRLRFHNNRQPNNWGDLKWACIFARPISSARPA